MPGVLIVVMAVMLDRTTTAASERAEKVARGGGGNPRRAPDRPRRRRRRGDPGRGLPLAHLRRAWRSSPSTPSATGSPTRDQRRRRLVHRHLRRRRPSAIKDVITDRLPQPACRRCSPSRPGGSRSPAIAALAFVFGGVRALRQHRGLPGRHLVLRPVARRDDHADMTLVATVAGDGPGPGLRRLDGPRPPGRPRHPAAARRRPDDPAVRLPDPGARALRPVPLHRDRRRRRVRRPGRHQAGRRRRQGGLADHDRGRPLHRPDHAGRRSPRSSCRWPRARSCWPPTRACSTCCPWSSSAAWSAPAPSATTSCSASPAARSGARALAAGITIVLLGVMLDRITRAAADVRRDDGPGTTPGLQRPAAHRPAAGEPPRISEQLDTPTHQTRRSTMRIARSRGARWAAVAAVASAGALRLRWRRVHRRGQTEANEEQAAEAGGECGDLNMAVNPWVGYEASAYVVGTVAEDRARLHGQLQGAQGGRLLAGLRHRRGRRRHRGLGPPRPGEEVLRRARATAPRWTSARSGNVGIIGWYVPPWLAEEHPDILDYENLNKYADGVRHLRVRRQGPVPRRRPVVRPVRRGDREQPRPRLQGRLLRQRGRLHRGVPQGRGEQGVPHRLLLRAAVLLRRGAAGEGRAAAVRRRAARTTRPRSPATTPRPS